MISKGPEISIKRPNRMEEALRELNATKYVHKTIYVIGRVNHHHVPDHRSKFKDYV